VGDDFALARVLTPVPNVENTPLNRHKRIVKVSFCSTISMRIDYSEGIRVGDRDMIRGYTNDRTFGKGNE